MKKSFEETLATTFYLFRCSQTMIQSDKNSVHRKLLCQIIFYRSLLLSPLFTFSANVDLTTPLGGAGINANVGLPAPANNLLTTAVIGLGISSLVNTVATVVIPYFNGDDATDDDTDTDTDTGTDTGRSMRNLFPQKTIDTLENAVVETLLKAKEKYL